MESDSGFNSLNAFVYMRDSYRSKNIAKSRWSVHLRFGRHPQDTAFSTVFDPGSDATEPHIWPNVCLADALPIEPIRIVKAHPEQTTVWPKHGDASWSHGTHHTEPISVFARCNPVSFITGHGTIPTPTSWRTTSGIHRLRPACGRRERPKRRCACCAG